MPARRTAGGSPASLPCFLLLFLQADVPASSESQGTFFSSVIWLLVALPFLAMLVIGLWNRRPKRTVREFDPVTFETEVLQSDEPVLVHFYRSWSIGDQVMVAQVERLAAKAHGFGVGFIDVERHPDVLALYDRVEAPALLLFAGGRRILQCQGVHDEADILRDVQDAIARWRRGHAEPAT